MNKNTAACHNCGNTEQFKAFRSWANDKGYDTAHTYDTTRNTWLCLNPMTGDLWKAWQGSFEHHAAQQTSESPQSQTQRAQ